MTPKLYVVPASHPCAAVERALRLKGIEYERVDMLPVVHRLQMKLLFGGRGTVPGLKLDGRKLTGSRAILRHLEEIAPEPAMWPAVGAAGPGRSEVELAEEWGDQVLQPLARRLSWAILSRCPSAMRSYSEGFKLPIPIGLAMTTAGPVAQMAKRLNKADDGATRSDLRTLPSHLDRVDDWIAHGVIGGTAPSAADLQIFSSVRLLLTLGDVRPTVAGRPCATKAVALFPEYPGEAPAGVLPPQWLNQSRTSAAATAAA